MSDYQQMSPMRLLELLWNDYGRRVAVTDGGGLQIVTRRFPPVPVALRQAVEANETQIRALFALERQPAEEMVR